MRCPADCSVHGRAPGALWRAAGLEKLSQGQQGSRGDHRDAKNAPTLKVVFLHGDVPYLLLKKNLVWPLWSVNRSAECRHFNLLLLTK